MSHGGGGSDIKSEPNLTSLLDLVLQLVMFFMVCANFENEQVSAAITLPESDAARIEKNEGDVLFVQIDHEGKMIVVGKNDPLDLLAMRVFLRDQYRDAAKLTKGKVETSVIIRADLRAKYEDVFKVMQACKEAGYHKLKLRALSPRK